MAKREYLNNKELHNAIIASQEKGELTREAQNMLMLLAQEASKRLKYSREEDRDDCVQQARLDLLKYWSGYKPQYKNAFAYYTEIAKKGFAKGWNKLYPKKYAGTISINGSSDGENDSLYSLGQ